MNRKKLVKLSDAELSIRIARYEKHEINLKRYGLFGAIIGVIGCLACMAMESEMVLLFTIIFFVGGGCYYMGVCLRKKAESLVRKHLSDFFEAELEKIFGPHMNTPEMSINASFLEKISPVDKSWNKCRIWRFYEGNYHGTHFSAANVELYVSKPVLEDSNEPGIETVFEGVVLRCRNICSPTLDIALRRPWTDNQTCDITDPAVFHQYFSARTTDNQPADDLVTPQLRELIQKLESLGGNHRVNALIFRDGDAILALSGYTFSDGLPSKGKSLQNLYEIRLRFTASLTTMGNLIDILRVEDTLYKKEESI